ncbi:MAG TPA: histidine kinase [Chitinophagaceae bacterium]|nr:histidine kinase [Chitinophagaceae bacterium]
MDSSEKNIYIAVLVAALFIGIILVYFLYSIILQHKRKRLLQQAHMKDLLTAIEDERIRIANDLHDDINPVLSAIKLQINTLDMVNEKSKDKLKQTNQHIDDMIHNIRSISYNLMPNLLIRKKLITAIQEYIHQMNQVQSMKIELDTNLDEEIDQQTGVHLFRMIQEIVQNTLKHAQANHLFIQLKRTTNDITLKTKDNGKGFDYASILKAQKGVGLQSLKLRTDLLHGKFNVNSTAQTGTQIDIQIPLLHDH